MHYEAKESISKNMEVLPCIPTFLGNENYDEKELIDRMSEELKKGNTFDIGFFMDAEMYLKDILEDCYSTWEFNQIGKAEKNLQDLYHLQYINEQILNKDEREINLIEFGENGINTTLITVNPIQDVSLPSIPFADHTRKGVLLQISKLLPEYRSKEITSKLKTNELSFSEVDVENCSTGLWFHDIQSINALTELLQKCGEYLKAEMSNNIKREMYELDVENKVIQDYIQLNMELESLGFDKDVCKNSRTGRR